MTQRDTEKQPLGAHAAPIGDAVLPPVDALAEVLRQLETIKQGVVASGVVEGDEILRSQVVPLTRRVEFVVQHVAGHADGFCQLADVVRLFEQVAGPCKVAV